MSFYNKEKLLSSIQALLAETEKKEDTVEIQISIKGYDLKRDVRFDGNVLLPHPKRLKEKVVVIGDKTLEEEAAKHEIPFISFDTVAGKNVEKNKLKKKIAKSNHGVITLTNFNRFFEISFFNRKRTPLYFYKPGTDLKTCYEEISRTCKFKLRNNTVLSFAAGYVELGEEKIFQNVQTGLDFFVTLLKKGVSNIASVNIKSNQSKAIKLY